ncbi:MAG TPA: lipopolysaccharide heptosyltransferase I [Acidobacteriaceae bacterium]|nr:lipopolysaccharide heptosyltransferase I [Acidobacteriaceae bacterium]
MPFSPTAPPDAPQRILIARLGAMGDVLHALPAVTALRVALPSAEIAWVVEPRWSALLRADSAAANAERTVAMPVVSRIFLAAAKRWSRAPLAPRTLGEIRTLAREMRREKYDLAIDLQGAVRSGFIARLARPGRLVGEESPREPIARHLFDQRVATKGVHVVEQALEVTSAAVGIALPMVAPFLPIDVDAERWRDNVVSNTRYVVINPGAGWGAKRWPADRYAQVARALAERGCQVFINASAEEAELGNTVAVASGGSARLLVCSIGELTSLLRRASLFVGGDTGPLHLAAALQRPCVGIYGPTDPVRNGPFGTASRVLRHPESKRDHSRRDETEAGLMTISSENVVAAADDLLFETETRS